MPCLYNHKMRLVKLINVSFARIILHVICGNPEVRASLASKKVCI